MKGNLPALLTFLVLLLPGIVRAQKNYTLTQYTADNGLPQNSVKNIVADSEGFIWLATEDGLVRFDGHRFYVFNRFNLIVSETRVTSIISARREITGRSKVSYASFIGGEYIKIENGNAVQDKSFYAKRRRDMLPLTDGRMIYTSTGLPNSVSQTGVVTDNNFHLIQAGDSESNYLCDSNSISYYAKWEKKYEMAYHTNSVRYFFTIGKNLYHFNNDASITGFVNKKPVSIPVFGEILKDPAYIAGKGNVQIYWNNVLAGAATGLYTIDILSKKVKLVEGTAGLYIKSIHVFNDELIWVTALEKGLMLVDKTGGLVAFHLDKNKYLASPHCVVDDGRGYFWIPTNKGLFQMSIKDLLQYAEWKSAGKKDRDVVKNQILLPSELFYMYHTKEEGFNTNEFNGGCQPCGLNLANGNISLPSLNGFVWFRPDKIHGIEPNGSIVFDKAEANQNLLKMSGDTLRFPLNPEYVSLHFSTAYFGNSYNLNMSYALVKQNVLVQPSDWSPDCLLL